MRFEVVYSYVYHECICDDGSGPDYDEALVGLIEAPSKGKAKGEMLKLIKAHWPSYDCSDNPFRSMKVQRLPYMESEASFNETMDRECVEHDMPREDVGTFWDNIKVYMPYTNIALEGK